MKLHLVVKAKWFDMIKSGEKMKNTGNTVFTGIKELKSKL